MIKGLSSFLWSYLEYLVFNNPETLQIVSPAFSGINVDHEDVIHIGEIISTAGHMDKLTDTERGIGVLLVCKYLSQSESTKKLKADDVRWIKRFPGKASFDENGIKAINELSQKISQKSNLMPDGTYAKLIELLK